MSFARRMRRKLAQRAYEGTCQVCGRPSELARFGVPLRPQRAIAFGKAALVNNSAALVRKARREARLGGRYADMVRERVAALLRLPPTMAPDKVEQRLGALPAGQDFSTLAANAATAGTPEGVLAAARALHQWQQEAIK